MGLSRWALWFGGLSFFACYLGQTVLGVIQPTVVTDLGLTRVRGAVGGQRLLPRDGAVRGAGGRLGDYYGHREVLLIALLIFALGSALAAVLPGFAGLIAGLAIAGIGASTLYPSSAAMIANRVSLDAPRAGDRHLLGDRRSASSCSGRCSPACSPKRSIGAPSSPSRPSSGSALAALGWLRVDNRPAGEPQRVRLARARGADGRPLRRPGRPDAGAGLGLGRGADDPPLPRRGRRPRALRRARAALRAPAAGGRPAAPPGAWSGSRWRCSPPSSCSTGS